jgi:hypothetical protein
LHVISLSKSTTKNIRAHCGNGDHCSGNGGHCSGNKHLRQRRLLRQQERYHRRVHRTTTPPGAVW